jgi:ketosteroid isomerase-like protein
VTRGVPALGYRFATMRTIPLAILVVLALPLFADPAAEVRQAETAFAKAFADRDQETFFSFVTEDAHFLSAKRTLTGKKEVRDVWSKFFNEPKAPFRWAPERVVVTGKGDIGLSTGPIHDPSGKLIGYFSSVWRQENGTWKVIFDGPGSSPPCEAK